MFCRRRVRIVPPVNRFRTVLFDLDGTLLDHFAAIHQSHAHTLRHFGLPAPSMDQVRRAIGGGLETAVARLFGPERAALVEQAVPVYRAYWAKNMLHGVALLPGSRELLEALNALDVTCGVLTNKHGPSARIVCEHLGVTPLLDGIFGAMDTPWLKPEKEFAAYALDALDAESATTCLIGDSPYDVAAGHEAGFPCFCVTTGTHTAEELKTAGAAGIFDDMFAVGREVFGLSLQGPT